jgi:hypothetical protein
LNVKILDAQAIDYTIYNVVGQVVDTGVFTPSINVSKLQSGMYMIQVNAETQQFVESFIVE